jgi:hypothetical protein
MHGKRRAIIPEPQARQGASSVSDVPARQSDSRSKLDRLIAESLAIEAEAAKEANAIGFMCRALTQATMPHKKTEGSEFKRQNGAFRLSLLAPSDIGLPYGSIPRLLVAWVTTEAVRTKERELELGESLSEFMRKLDLVPTGGRWGSITRLKDQMRRLFASSVSATYDDGEHWALRQVQIIEDADIWWEPKRPDQAALWRSSLILGSRFFNEVTSTPVPIDMRALRALKGSPLALDIYVWLTYRMSYLSKQTVIPWEALELQFGADYQHTRQFKAAFIRHLRSVLTVYPAAKVEADALGLELRPSHPHIPFDSR